MKVSSCGIHMRPLSPIQALKSSGSKARARGWPHGECKFYKCFTLPLPLLEVLYFTSWPPNENFFVLSWVSVCCICNLHAWHGFSLWGWKGAPEYWLLCSTGPCIVTDGREGGREEDHITYIAHSPSQALVGHASSHSHGQWRSWITCSPQKLHSSRSPFLTVTHPMRKKKLLPSFSFVLFFFYLMELELDPNASWFCIKSDRFASLLNHEHPFLAKYETPCD